MLYGKTEAAKLAEILYCKIEAFGLAIWFGNSVWHFPFGISVWHFSRAILFGNSVW
jgi:hypothetical protein